MLSKSRKKAHRNYHIQLTGIGGFVKQIKVILIPTIMFLQFISCKDTGTGPNQKQFKDPRQMTWAVDTLTYPGSLDVSLGSIWGSSPTDVYAVGHNESNRGQFWHYDGKKWECIDLFQYVEQSSWSLVKVFGFGPNDFWVIGGRDRTIAGYDYKESLILQNKSSWVDHKLVYNGLMMDITGTSSRNIWACGRNGIVMNYNGYSWKVDTIKVKKFPYDTDYVLAGITESKNEVILVARTTNPRLTSREQYYIRGTMDNWRVIDSTIFTSENWGDDERWGDLGIFQTSSGKIFSFGDGGIWVLDLNNNRWNSILKNNYSIRGLYGTDENYLIAVADFGRVWFFNGNEWIGMFSLVSTQSQIHFYDIWTDGEEIFLLGIDNNKTFILHGK